jgi:preprotein translocase subunit Sec61beta
MGRVGQSSGLVRYCAAAVLVRASDAGAVAGLILLAVDPDLRTAAGPAVGGLLVAALTAPHLLGPWIANRLDRAGDGRGLLAGSYLVYAVALAAGSLAVGRVSVVVPLVLVGLAGCCGPLLTGGLSSRLTAIAGRR